jgi:hypothetical protein
MLTQLTGILSLLPNAILASLRKDSRKFVSNESFGTRPINIMLSCARRKTFLSFSPTLLWYRTGVY